MAPSHADGSLVYGPDAIIPHNSAVRHSHMWGPRALLNRCKGLAVLEFRYIPVVRQTTPMSTQCNSAAGDGFSVAESFWRK